MTGIVFSPILSRNGSAQSLLNRSTFYCGRSWQYARDGYELAIQRVDDFRYWAPYHNTQTNTLIAIAGRAGFDQSQWKQIDVEAPRPNTLGRIARYLSNRFSGDPASLTELNNGACIILVWELAKRRLTVITDRLGAFPIFSLEKGGALYLSNNADVVADAGNINNLDMGTLAEVLAFGGSVHPYSHFEHIEQLDPAAIYTWNLTKSNKPSINTYWAPEYNPWPKAEDSVEQIEQAFRVAIERRTVPQAGRVGIFLSGGTDSRTILFGANDPTELTAITFHEGDSVELEITRSLAERAGANHLLFERNQNSYFSHAEDAISCVGGMWNIVDAHFAFCLDLLQRENFGTLLSGCYVDYMFKGLLLNRKPVSAFGKDLGLEKRGPFQLWYYLWRKPVANRWDEVTMDRLHSRLDGCVLPPQTDLDRLNIESRRLIPLAREGDWLFRGLAWRTLPWDLLTSDIDIIKAYLRTPVSGKLNAKVFRRAADRICNNARDIPNANSGLPLSAGTLRTAAAKISGRFFSSQHNSTAQSSTNANFRELILVSEKLRQQWLSSTPIERAVLPELLGFDPWAVSLADWAKPKRSEQFYRIYSTSLWLRGQSAKSSLNIPT